jgi:hypothetical protein
VELILVNLSGSYWQDCCWWNQMVGEVDFDDPLRLLRVGVDDRDFCLNDSLRID